VEHLLYQRPRDLVQALLLPLIEIRHPSKKLLELVLPYPLDIAPDLAQELVDVPRLHPSLEPINLVANRLLRSSQRRDPDTPVRLDRAVHVVKIAQQKVGKPGSSRVDIGRDSEVDDEQGPRTVPQSVRQHRARKKRSSGSGGAEDNIGSSKLRHELVEGNHSRLVKSAEAMPLGQESAGDHGMRTTVAETSGERSGQLSCPQDDHRPAVELAEQFCRQSDRRRRQRSGL
jgi:hypothetical protein